MVDNLSIHSASSSFSLRSAACSGSEPSGQLEKQGTGNGNGNGNGKRERERTTDGAQNGIDMM